MALALILNPHAGAGFDAADVAQFAAQLQGHGPLHISSSPDELCRRVDGLRRAGVDEIAVVGGDGTLSSVVSALIDVHGADAALPALVPLRGGTMNTICNALGVRGGRPQRLLTRALTSQHRTRQVATLQVGPRHGFLFGTGVMSSFLAEYYAAGGNRPGPWTAAALLGRGVLSTLAAGDLGRRLARPVRGQLLLDGELQPHDNFVALGAGTVEQVGLGFRPYANATQRNDAFRYLAFPGSLPQLALALPALHRGRAGGPTHLGWTRQLALRGFEQPLRYFIDGELHRAQDPLTVGLGPQVRVRCV